jgi:hypothetical protein
MLGSTGYGLNTGALGGPFGFLATLDGSGTSGQS